MKNKYLSGTAALTGLTLMSGAGQAADLPMNVYTKAPPPAVMSWTGGYVGGVALWGSTKETTLYDDLGPAQDKNYSNSLAMSGFGAGVEAGYNWQMSQFVFGVEGDITGTSWKNSTNAFAGNFDPSGKKRADISTQLDYLATLRGRLGVAFDKTLLYVTGGVAAAQASYYNSNALGAPDDTATQPFGHGQKVHYGEVAGAGVEWKYDQKLSFKLEGLYYFLDDKTTATLLTKDAKVTSIVTYGLKDISVVRAGANWHF